VAAIGVTSVSRPCIESSLCARCNGDGRRGLDRGSPRDSGIGEELVAAITAGMCDGDCSRLKLGAVLLIGPLLADTCCPICPIPESPTGLFRSLAGIVSKVVRLITLFRPPPANEAAARAPLMPLCLLLLEFADVAHELKARVAPCRAVEGVPGSAACNALAELEWDLSRIWLPDFIKP